MLWKKVISTVLLLAMFSSGLAYYIWQETAQRPAPRQRPAPGQKSRHIWSASAAFSGRTPEQTGPFTVDRGPWRLRWEIDGPPNSASVGFTVFSQNPALPPVLEKNGLRPPDKGMATIKQNGAFYILVSSYEANWIFTVETQSP